MIRLLASDVDGTLVEESAGEIRKEIPELFGKLMKQGVVCCVASGRQFYSIQQLFRDVAEDIVYIAENGAYIHYKKEDIFVKPMKREDVVGIMEDFYRNKDRYDLEVVVSTPDYCYLETDNQEFIDKVHYNYRNKYKVVEHILDEDIPVIKIAFRQIGNIRGLAEHTLIPKWNHRVQVCISGAEWVDFMDNTVDKGQALRFVQDYFHISKEETMVFGDNSNDIGMFREAGESYAVENTREEVRRFAKHTCKPYWEMGAYQVMKTLLREGMENSLEK